MGKINFKPYFNCDYPGYKTFEKNVLTPIFGDYYQPEAVAENYIANNDGEIAAEKANIKDIKRMATIMPTDGNASFNPIEVFDVTVEDNSKLSRSRVAIQQFIRRYTFEYSHALIIFHYETPTGRSWRFSYFYKEGSLKETTNARRYTYLFGENEKVRTADERFNTLFDDFHKKSHVVTDEDIENAFSVEKLSDEFFEKYLAFYVSFVKFITGKKESKEAIKKECFQQTLKQIASLGKKDTYDQYNKYFMPRYKDEETCDKAVRDYVKKMMGRLVFLHFLQRKEWMCGDRDFMHHLFLNSDYQDDFLDRVLEPLFFAVLNTQPDKRKLVCKKHNDYPYNKDQRVDWDEKLIEQWETIPYLNGGLFEQEKIDECRTIFPKEYFEALFNFFDEYNFTIDENDPHDAIVGVDPEMLSKIFENLLEDNKDKGAFYTPKTIVHYMCTESLIAYLKEKCKDAGITDADLRKFVLEPHTYIVDDLKDEQRACLTNALKNVHVCDPAIGSGAFPMGMLNAIYACRHELEPETPSFDIKLHIIQNNIFGVDIEQGAVDIARLRFWLSLVVEEQQPHPLPNLDYRIVRGNSLLTTFMDEHVNLDSNSGRAKTTKLKKELADKQKEYYSLNGEEKLKKEVEIKLQILDILETQLSIDRKAAKQKEITDSLDMYNPENVSAKAKKLSAEAKAIAAQKQKLITEIEKKRNFLTSTNRDLFDKARTDIEFFDWKIIFSDVFDNNNGFDIVIGNPPYVKVESIPVKDKAIYKKTYSFFEKRADLFSLFVEKALLSLSSKEGIVTYIIPSVVHSNLSYNKLRGNILGNNWLTEVCYTGGDVFNAPTVDTTILRLNKKGNNSIVLKNALDFANPIATIVPADYFAKYNNVISISNERTNSLMDKLFSEDLPILADSYSVFQGIVTGCNPAFIFDSEKEALAKGIDRELLHPLCHGRDIEKYTVRSRERMILYIDNNVKIEDYPQTEKWLNNFKDKLSKRREALKGTIKWYGLQWPRIKSELDLKEKIWIQRTRNEKLKIRVVATLDNNSSYTSEGILNIIPLTKQTNLYYLLGILNSKLVNYLFATKFLNLAVKAEYLKQLRIPNGNKAAENHIASLAKEVSVSKATSPTADTSAQEQEIDRLVYKLYGLTYDEVKIVDPDTPITEEEYNKD